MPNEREAMLLTAADFLGRRPNATQDEIAKAVGVSRATLHRHFAGRAELLQALTDQATSEFHRAIQTTRSAEGTCADAVRRLVAAIEESAPYVALFYTLSQDDSPTAEYLAWEEVDAAILELFERGQAAGEFTTRLTAAWMTEVFYGLVASAEWAIQSGRCARRDFTHMVTQTLLSGVGHHQADEQSV